MVVEMRRLEWHSYSLANTVVCVGVYLFVCVCVAVVVIVVLQQPP